MDINEIIRTRRAVSPKFLRKGEVKEEIVWQLLENANWAPNHKKTEPWRFKVYTGTAKHELAEKVFEVLMQRQADDQEISQLKVENLKNTLEKVPVAIAIILQRDTRLALPEWEEIAAVSMAVQNMWLTAGSLGLSAFWATPPFVGHLGPAIEISENQKFLGFFYVGYGAFELPSPGRGDIREKAEWK